MGYGIVNEYAGTLTVANGYDDDYGEVQTRTTDVTSYGDEDVSIHVALNTWEIYTPWRTDNASIGLVAYVLGGNLTTFGTPDTWPTLLLANPVSSFRVGWYLSGNGGYMKASWFLQLWGDPSSHSTRFTARSEPAHVVYEPSSGRVRHVHTRLSLGRSAATADLGGVPVEIARSMGHEGDLAVLEVAAEELGTGRHRVDLDANRLVSEPR